MRTAYKLFLLSLLVAMMHGVNTHNGALVCTAAIIASVCVGMTVTAEAICLWRWEHDQDH